MYRRQLPKVKPNQTYLGSQFLAFPLQTQTTFWYQAPAEIEGTHLIPEVYGY